MIELLPEHNIKHLVLYLTFDDEEKYYDSLCLFQASFKN